MEERAMVLNEIRAQYPSCRVVDLGRAIELQPPLDGRYGTVTLELPMRPLATSCRDERMLCRELMTRMNSLTRALPDIGMQTLDAINMRQVVHGTVWEGAHMEAFLRFGILRSHGQVLKIVPPEYANDVQIILRTRSNEDLETLIDLLDQSIGYEYDCQGWSYSYMRDHGCNHVFWTMKIVQDLVAIRDKMEDYWQLVNGSWSCGQEQRKYINSWLAGADFR